MSEIIYRQKSTAIPVIVISYLILAVMEYINSGFEEFNWLGMSVLGIFAIIGILRIGKFGVVKITGDSLIHYNWLFQAKSIKLQKIKEVDVRGMWLNSLRVICDLDTRKKTILLGTFTGEQLISLVKNLQARNSSIVLGDRLSKMIGQTHG